jgi:hypothetical protein
MGRIKARNGASLTEVLAMHSSPPTAAGCVLWVGAVAKSGYGNVCYQGRTTGAHRAAWELANGPIPTGLQVCHSCDVRTCINVAHMRLGTARDNAADKVLRSRQARGETSAAAKLTADDVRMIRQRPMSLRKMAAALGVQPRAVQDVLRGKTWSHIS